MRRSMSYGFVMMAFLLSMAGCADPAADKPDAVVQEAAPVPAEVSGKRFTIAEDSTIGFVGSKVTGSHEGGFESFSGEIVLVGNDPVGSSVKLTIDTTSLWSDNERLTGHLKSDDFFGVETYPEAVFESTAIAKTDTGYEVTGNLTLHGVTKSITFPAHIEAGEAGAKAEAEFSIKRFDFDIVYKGRADDLIRDEVVIRFLIRALPVEAVA